VVVGIVGAFLSTNVLAQQGPAQRDSGGARAASCSYCDNELSKQNRNCQAKSTLDETSGRWKLLLDRIV